MSLTTKKFKIDLDVPPLIDTTKDRIFGLDLMRAIAILGVLGSHALWIFPEESGAVVALLKMGGVMGVELFFVLSGFLIGRILLGLFTKEDFRAADFKYFIVRRWFRTLPNYYLVLVLNILLVAAIGRELPESLPYYFGFLQNLVGGMDIFFTESWSLPIEEFAYIVGPLLLYALVSAFAKAKKDKLFLIATIGIIFIFLVTKIIYNVSTTETSFEYWNINLKAVVLYRLDAIYYGVLAAYLSITFERLWGKLKEICLLLGVLLFFGFQVLLGSFGLDIETAPFIWNVLYLPIVSISFCLFLPFLSGWQSAPRWFKKPITTLSILSYAMYLLHYGLILQTMRWIQPIENLPSSARFGFVAIYILLTIVISYGWYKVYEKPMTNLRDRPGVRKYFGA